MRYLLAFTVLAISIGCGSEEPAVEITVNGVPVDIDNTPENDTEKATAALETAKQKWLDESGDLKEQYRRGTANRSMAEMEFSSIAENHPETEAGDEAGQIASRLTP